MRLFLLFSLLGHLFLLSSCKKNQPADSAFFVKSDVISVSASGHEGSASHKITDLWVYTDGQYQGTYPVGNLIPIPNKGKGARINVFAGIKNNGIADTRIFYPFFDFLTVDTLVETGKTITRSFTFKYRAATNFTWTENFDSPSGFSVKKSDGSDAAPASASPEDCFEHGSLVITLSGTDVLARIESASDGFSLPSGSSNIYLELNYKCNIPFTVGLTNDNGSSRSPALTVNAQENWNKIYIQLSNAAGTLITNKYKVYFEFAKSQDDPETRQVFLDNIKLLYL